MSWGKFLVLMVVGGMGLQASTLVMTLTGPANVTLGSITVPHTQVTITEVAETNNRQVWTAGSGYYINNSSASISIPEFGDFTFLTPTISTVDNLYGSPYFISGSLGAGSVVGGPNTLAFGTWNMLTSLAPTSGRSLIDGWIQYPATTTGGVLVLIQDQSIPTFTFSAILAPEPATPILITAGISMLALLRKRFKHSPAIAKDFTTNIAL